MSNEIQERKHVFELCRKSFYPGMSLGAMAVILDHPAWLKRENVRRLTSLHGKLPFAWSSTDTIVVVQPWLSLGDHSAIYLKLEGQDRSEEVVFEVLKGNDKEAAHLSIVVLEVDCIEVE